MGKVSQAERDRILLDYECAYIAANGMDPKLRLLSNGMYTLDALRTQHVEFNFWEFPLMARNLWERAEENFLIPRSDSLEDLIKRLMPINIHEVIANEIQTFTRGR
jgi:hypothetical protein